jgi:integrase
MSQRIPAYLLFRPKNLGYANWKGKRRYFPGPYDSRQSITAYRAWLAEVLVETRPDRMPPIGQLTISELVERWLAHCSTYYANSGDRRSIYAATRLLRIMYGAVSVGEFGPLSLSTLQDVAVAGRLLRNGEAVWEAQWARSTINHHVAHIKRCFAWGVSKELVPASVSNAIRYLPALRAGKTKARETPPVLPVSPTDVDATIQYCTRVLRAMILFQRSCGCRPQSVCDLRPMDIDRSRKVWRYTPASHKTAWRGIKLVIFLGPESQSILTPYLDRQADAYCFSPAEAWAERAAAIRATRKRPLKPSEVKLRAKAKRLLATHYTTGSYNHAVRRTAAKAGIRPWHVHQLRHSRATEIRERYGLEAAQVFLGQSHAKVTEIYAERNLRLAEQIAAEIG